MSTCHQCGGIADKDPYLLGMLDGESYECECPLYGVEEILHIAVGMDGAAWFATFDPEVNQMEETYGWGDTPVQAVIDLMHELSKAPRNFHSFTLG